jgi:hypothetical protein
MAEQRLTVVPDELQAEMVRSVLETHGIQCVVRRPALGELQWGAINVGMGGPREIVVDAADLDAARELLDAPVEEAATPDEPVAEAPEGARPPLGAWWALVVVLLFGVPLVLFAIWWLAALLDVLA